MSSRCRASPPREAGGCEAAPRIPSASALLGRALCHYCYSFAFFFFFYSPHPIPSRCPAPRRAVLLRAQVAPCAPAGAAPSPLSAEPGRVERPPAPAPPPPPRGTAPPGRGAGGREAGGRSFSGGEGRTRPRGGSSPALAMKRKQKRFLQMTLLFTAALIFLPDIGLWSLYREKHLVKPAEPAEPQVAGMSGPGLWKLRARAWGAGWEHAGCGEFSAVVKAAGCAERSGVLPPTLVCLAVCDWMLTIPLTNSPLSFPLKTQRCVRQLFFFFFLTYLFIF